MVSILTPSKVALSNDWRDATKSDGLLLEDGRPLSVCLSVCLRYARLESLPCTIARNCNSKGQAAFWRPLWISDFGWAVFSTWRQHHMVCLDAGAMEEHVSLRKYEHSVNEIRRSYRKKDSCKSREVRLGWRNFGAELSGRFGELRAETLTEFDRLWATELYSLVRATEISRWHMLLMTWC